MIAAASGVALTATLPVEVLRKSTPSIDAQLRRVADALGRTQFAGFQDQLEHARAAGLARGIHHGAGA
jgi:hypothetical protein